MASEFVFEPLSDAHNRAAFSCGVEPLDRYPRQQARQDMRRNLTAVLVLIHVPSSGVAGYYTLSTAAIKPSDVPDDLIRKLPRYPALPATLIGRLAVDSDYRGRGLDGVCAALLMQRYEGRRVTAVRRARPHDAAAIARIYNQGIDERVATFETEPRGEEDIVAALAERGERYPTLVTERDGVVIACAWASTYRPRACYAGIAEFSVYVDGAARGSGAGRQALEALIEECERRGFWKLVSRVFPENSASRALCQRLGFREVGVYRRHARLDGVWRDCVIVERLLGDTV